MVGCADQRPAADSLLIGANADLTTLLTRLARRYEAENPGLRVEISFAASGVLRTQAQYGAPFDAIIVAAPDFLDGVTGVASPVSLAHGELAIYGDDPPKSLDGLRRSSGRIAIASPKTAPFGRAAIELLRSQTWFPEAEARLAILADVRQAKVAVDTGAAEFALVSLTQAKEGPKAFTRLGPHPSLALTALALNSGRAERFLDWLREPAQQAEFAEAGLRPAAPGDAGRRESQRE